MQVNRENDAEYVTEQFDRNEIDEIECVISEYMNDVLILWMTCGVENEMRKRLYEMSI